MFEKMVKSTEELNAVAAHLRGIQNFDELRRLARERLVPKEDVEDFIAGKRYQLAEIKTEEKEYRTAEEKLREEMWLLKDREFADILSQHLIRKCGEESFSAQVLQRHKTLLKCLDHVMEKAYHIAEEKYKGKSGQPGQRDQNVALALSEIQVYAWAEEYYALDDAAEEKKKEEEDRKKQREEREKEEKRKAATAKRKAAAGAKTKAAAGSGTQEKAKAPEKPKEAQMSLFDMIGTSQEEKNEGV